MLSSVAPGASDAETLWSLVASLAAGNGALSDLDALREDDVGRDSALARGAVEPAHGERMAAGEVPREDAARACRCALAQPRVAPAVVDTRWRSAATCRLFVDGTAIEVDGALFEKARVGYDGTRQYWLNGVFVGSLWASGRLRPGGGDVAGGWRKQQARPLRNWLPECRGAPLEVLCDTFRRKIELGHRHARIELLPVAGDEIALEGELTDSIEHHRSALNSRELRVVVEEIPRIADPAVANRVEHLPAESLGVAPELLFEHASDGVASDALAVEAVVIAAFRREQRRERVAVAGFDGGGEVSEDSLRNLRSLISSQFAFAARCLAAGAVPVTIACRAGRRSHRHPSH